MQIRKQAGFTLIELIMVIAVLGILAAFALPKFADLSKEARIATINGVAAAMRSGSAIAHAAYLAAGSPSTGIVKLEGPSYTLVHGYPATADILEIAQVAAGNGMTATTGSGIAEFNASCRVVYTQASANTDTPPVITPPTIAVTATGC